MNVQEVLSIWQGSDADCSSLNSDKNIRIGSSQNIPLALLGQCCSSKRRYIRSQDIESLAVSSYKKNGKGITFNDFLSRGLALHKEQAQITLKHCLQKRVLFTLANHKPQRYYPSCLKSEILKVKISKNIPIGVTGVRFSDISDFSINNNMNSSRCEESVVIQTLEGYVLPLLPSAPLHIHKMHFKLSIAAEHYQGIILPVRAWNKAKEHKEIIGTKHVRYQFYANGTVMVFTESSNNPFKLEDEIDLISLIAFFGQVRDRPVRFLADTHERIVPGILEWELTQCDINKDIKVGEGLQYTGLKVQVKHFDRLFRVYIKSIGKDTACRVEESLNPKKSFLQAMNEIFPNQNQRQQQESSTDDCTRRKITEIHDMVKRLVDLHKCDSAIVGHKLEERWGS